MSILTDSERKLLSDLREAESRATKGPWVVDCDRSGPGAAVVHKNSVLCHQWPHKRVVDSPTFDHAERKIDSLAANLDLIALARNNLTPLLDLVERLDRELCEVKRSLKHEQAARIAMERQYVPE